MPDKKPKCLIIGAGLSGLVTLRHVKEVADVKCFDAKDQPGGLWVYTDVSELNHPDLKSDVYYKNSGHMHSSMYKELVTNVPHHLLAFKDFPHQEGTPVFLLREHLFEYILRYTKHFDLYKHLKLSTFVLSVRLSAGLTDEEKKEWAVEGKRKFAVKYCQSKDESQVGYEEFDYVIVCNGHNSYPVIPKIEGDEEFQGERFPTHCFRDYSFPKFKGKDILIVGGNYSASDFMIQILYNPYIGQDYVGKIYIAGPTEALEKSTDFKELYEKGKVTLKRGRVQKVGKNDVTFADGTKAKVDMMCYGCGYHFRFPFLENEDKLIDWSLDVHEGKYWGPLFARMFAIREPNLMFIGNHDESSNIQTIMEKQGIVAKKYMAGQVELPSEEEMNKSLENDLAEFKKLNVPMKNYYRLYTNDNDWDYVEQLRELVKMESDPLFHDTWKEIGRLFLEFTDNGNWLSYRRFNFCTVIPEGFKDTTEYF